MGSPISVIVANQVMKTIKTKMQKDFISPILYLATLYSDSFVVLKKTYVASFHKLNENIEVIIM